MRSANRPSAAASVRQQPLPVTAVALACDLPEESGSTERIWIPAGVSHRIRIADPAHRARLLAALFDMKPDPELKLVLLGADVHGLPRRQQLALRARLAYLPATGGLLSCLDAWENIILPLGFRDPRRVPEVAGEVYALLTGLGMVPQALLGKLPEEMTLLERKTTGFARILLESPDLVLVENFAFGLDSVERLRIPYFAATYQARHPGGTFVQLEDVLGE